MPKKVNLVGFSSAYAGAAARPDKAAKTPAARIAAITTDFVLEFIISSVSLK